MHFTLKYDKSTVMEITPHHESETSETFGMDNINVMLQIMGF
jgi:hypothetical protein